MLVYEAQGSLPMIFKPLTTLFTKNNTTTNPLGIVGEPIQVSVEVQNPLEISLGLKDVYLLWQYKDKSNRFAANEIMGNDVEHMKTHSLKNVTLLPNATQDFVLSITPLVAGEVILKGVCYHLCCSSLEQSIKGKQNFFKQEKNTDAKGGEVKNADNPNKRFVINVVPSAPCLQVYFGEIRTDVIRNEIQQVNVELRNISNITLWKIYMATSAPELITSNEFQKNKFVNDKSVDLTSLATREKEARKNHVTFISLPNGKLEPGQVHNVSLWLKAPDSVDHVEADVLIYYESIQSNSIPG